MSGLKNQVLGARILNRLFDYPEDGRFEVTPGCTNIGLIRKPVPGAPKLHIFQ